MQAIIPQVGGGAAVPMDVSALAFALANMEPDVWAPVRPGEAWADVIARRDAARDILDDLLAEAADIPDAPKTRVFDRLSGDGVQAAWTKSSYSGTYPEGNCVQIAVVRPVPGRGCMFCGGDGTDGAGHTCMVCGGSGGRS
jgi:hypothetical protein